MAGGVGNLLELPVKTDANGALVLAIGSTTAASGTTSTGAPDVLPALQVKTTAANELVVRFV